MTETLAVQGTVASGFEGVRDEFNKNLTERGDVGASFAAYVEGELVVDLWGGLADPVTQRAWERDTVGLAYSVTKGASSIVVHLLADRGLIDLDAPVAQYWPEFAVAGKEAITVTQLMSHQAGLPVPGIVLTREQLLAGTPVVQVLERQEPLWAPGSNHGYHALTFGWLVGELVRRVTGRSLGTVFADQIAGPLGLDFWIGLPQDRVDSVAVLVDGERNLNELDLIPDPTVRDRVRLLVQTMMDPTSLFARTLSTNGALPTPSAGAWNDPAVWTIEQPAAGGITNGRSLARLYAACVGEVGGIRLLSESAVDRARAQQARGADAVTMAESRFGTGFQLAIPSNPLLGESSFGHSGAGGALGFADVDRRIGFGYVQNKLSSSLLGDPRTPALIGALSRAAG